MTCPQSKVGGSAKIIGWAQFTGRISYTLCGGIHRPGTLVAQGKYTLPLPYVIARI
jgi:hypothetical protein